MGIRKFEFVAKTLFLSSKFISFNHLYRLIFDIPNRIQAFSWFKIFTLDFIVNVKDIICFKDIKFRFIYFIF